MNHIRFVAFAVAFSSFLISCSATKERPAKLNEHSGPPDEHPAPPNEHYTDFSSATEGCQAGGAVKIPKIMHQIWHNFGQGKQPSPELQAWSDEIKAKYDDWEHVLWKNEKSANFVKEKEPGFYPTYVAYDKEIKRVDAVRYVIMKHIGGVYIDFDTKFVRRIDPGLAGCDVVLGEYSSVNCTSQELC